MTAWQDVEQAEPEFAQRVRALFDAHRHKTIATLRADGSPRISWIERIPTEIRALASVRHRAKNQFAILEDRFHAEIAEVVDTHLNKQATMLVVEWWTPTWGLRRIERE